MREEGRSLRSSTMNALRAPSCSVSHSPLPDSGSPDAGRLALPPRARVRIADRERRSRPIGLAPVGARAERMDRRRHRAVGTASSMVAFVSTSGTVDSSTVSRAEPGHARIGLRHARHRQARQRHRTKRIDTRSPPRAKLRHGHRVHREPLAPHLQPRDRQREVARPAAPHAIRAAQVGHRRRPERRPVPAAARPRCCATRPTSARRRPAPARCGRSPHAQPRARRTAPPPPRQGEGSASRQSEAVRARVSAPCERSRSFANSAHGWYWSRYALPAPAVSPAPRNSEHVTRSPIVCDTLKK